MCATPNSNNYKLFLLYFASVSATRLLFHEYNPLAPSGAADDVDPIERSGEPEQYTNASVSTYPIGRIGRSVPLPRKLDVPSFVNLRLNSLSGFVEYAPVTGSSK